MSLNKNLYNKYRPKSFSEIVGQETVKQLLFQTLKKEKLLQSFLFYGSHGTGKTSLARIFAKAQNCDKFFELGEVCNNCKYCKLINESATIDICEIDSASNSGVDHVRELIQNSQYMPLDLKKKVYLIDECHNLSNSAWNALLKTIEEPYSENVIFIFLTTNIYKIPDTILSRCSKFNFLQLSDEELEEVMRSVEEGEGKSFDNEARKLLISLSKGSARECVSLVEQVFLSIDKPIATLSDVETLFSLAHKTEQLLFIELLSKSGNSKEARKRLVEIVDDLIIKNKHLLNYFSSLLAISMDVQVYKLTKDSSLLKRLNGEEVKKLSSYQVDYLRLCDILFKELRRFQEASSKGDWAKLILFHLIANPNTPIEEEVEEEEELSVDKSIEEEQEPEEIDLSVPKEYELKFLYNTIESNRNDMKSRSNYQTYQELKENLDLDPFLREALFDESVVFPSSKMITTDKTVLLLFKEKKAADRFNEIVKPGSEYETKLNELFLGNYFWWAATIEQMKFYKNKEKPTDSKIKNAFVEDGDKEVFQKLLEALTS